MNPLLALLTSMLFLPGPASAAPPVTVPNWTAPPFWTPQPAPEDGDASRWEPLATQALPSAPLPFVAITPCRMADTRGNGFGGPYGPPRLTAASPRDIPVWTQCGIPSDARAVSGNFTATNTLASGYLAVYPQGTVWGGVSTLNYRANMAVANAAVVPLGDTGAMTVALGGGDADVIIDVNGYYAAASLVSSLNGLTGDVVLAQGSNVTITPSGNTLTIAASGGGGGSLPAGATGQTLRHDGAGWVASSQLLNSGAAVTVGGDLGVGGNLTLPASSSTGGQLLVNGVRFLHRYGSQDTFLGEAAGNFTTTGDSNTGVGYYALNAVTTGTNNTGVGLHALAALTTGTHNSALGRGALYSNTTGSDNTGVGRGTLGSNTTASGNTALGALALQVQSYSNGGVAWNSDNTAVGYQALQKNQPTSSANGMQNTALGANSLLSNTTGSRNSAIGHGALHSNTVGDENAAVGVAALFANTTANRNTAFGYGALFTQSFSNGGAAWDSENTAVGYESLQANQPSVTSNGIQNSAIGAFSLAANTTGSFNVAVGHGALGTATTADSNVAVGRGALHYTGIGHHNVAVGDQAAQENTIGSWNVAVGTDALMGNATGAGNVAIGYRAGYTEMSSNKLHIGNSLGTLIYGQFDTGRVAIAATDPTVALDVNGQIRSRTISSASASTSVCFSATGVLGTCTSDLRLKKNVTPLVEEMDVLGALSCLRGVTYEWDTSLERARDLGPRREIGLVAQEVETVLPQVVSTAPDGYKSLDYARISAFLVDVARAQQKEIAALRELLVRQEARIRGLEVSRDRGRPE